MKTRIVLVRHGEAHVNLPSTGPVVLDTEGLTGRGVAQAEALRDRLAARSELAPDALVSSTFPRAWQTSQIVAAAFGLEVEPDEDLQEWRVGEDTSELTSADIEAAWDRLMSGHGLFDRVTPDTESYADFALRVGNGLDHLAQRHVGRTVIVFTHGGVIDLAMSGWGRGSWLEPPRNTYRTRHTSLTEWVAHHADGSSSVEWELRRYNDDLHVSTD
ncbi:MAG: histidine phosphatase family protein [Actinomycetes bacterium]